MLICWLYVDIMMVELFNVGFDVVVFNVVLYYIEDIWMVLSWFGGLVIFGGMLVVVIFVMFLL